jgi:hypothetical protein
MALSVLRHIGGVLAGCLGLWQGTQEANVAVVLVAVVVLVVILVLVAVANAVAVADASSGGQRSAVHRPFLGSIVLPKNAGKALLFGLFLLARFGLAFPHCGVEGGVYCNDWSIVPQCSFFSIMLLVMTDVLFCSSSNDGKLCRFRENDMH